ncbi:MAG: DUF1501 domain-containing protein [Planctomyces sp.]|nr:DUF1501 domain-containing protein [Planctomyces sp.]
MTDDAPSPFAATRREALLRGGGGFGAIVLSALLRDAPLRADAAAPPLHTPRQLPALAKRVIFLFMEGGPSHLDSFDPKPELNRLAGQPLPPGYKRVITAMGEIESPLLASKRRWRQHGESGLWVSDWLPWTAARADDLAVIRSCWTNGINHSGGVCQMNTGSPLAGRPSLGAWVSYGLGTENQNLPAFVVMTDSKDSVINGPRNWGAGFMPAAHQGTKLELGDEPIRWLNPAPDVTPPRQQARLKLLHDINREHADARPQQTELDARIRAYELAFRMQAHAPEAIELGGETAETQKLYGLDNPVTAPFGRNCLLARRLVERGVRFVQLYSGSGSKWDAHAGIEKNHAARFAETDQPVAALLTDLKRRGLLDDTLVIWGGEFGRTPMSEKGDGRDHNPAGFTMWLAGGGVRGGQVIGATDDLGFHAVEDRLHVHDLHATILYLLGIDHSQLVFRANGRPERPTLNEGEAYTRITGKAVG